MIPVNYHHLYYFWIVAQEGSITAATKKLLLAQPTLTAQISELEASLGKKLLNRGRKGVSLTRDGEIAFEHCEAIFRRGNALLAALKSGKAPPAPLRLGVAKSLPGEMARKVLNWIESRDPSIQTVVSTGTIEELQERLFRRALDAAISDQNFSALAGSGLRSRMAASIPVLFVAAQRLKREIGPFPRKGQALRMLFRAVENPTRREVDRYLREHELKAVAIAEIEDSDLIRELAIQGKGVAALSVLAAREDLSSKRLVPLHKKPTGIKEEMWLLSSAHPHADESLGKVIDSLMRSFSIKI